MTIEQKVAKTLAELEIKTQGDVHKLFSQYAETLENERSELFNKRVSSEAERNKLCKALRDRWLGRKSGLLAQIDEHQLKTAPKAFRPVVGKFFNTLRKKAAELEYESLLRDFPAQLFESSSEQPFRPQPEAVDLTLPGYRQPLGSIHPVRRVEREIEEIFLGLGFSIETGPEIESVYYNFDALNIPESHPSRDDVDTFYIDSKMLLRTHTSPVQIRAIEKHGAPLYVICPGRCYRNDKPDATHSPMFHQIEGLAVDTDITFADLKGTLDFFARRFFGERVRTSFHPSFFPFTEPSGEVSISCIFCGGKGCPKCKGGGWIEVMGCGMVHPEVLHQGGLDPERYSGWAFGLGIERYAILKYGVEDIQLFFQSDLRFLEQFT